ncbi:MAG TPA: DUF262 domain-containing protein [Longimicrobium sp.]|jgi:hypothetical protein|uniref:GmrSD restriction endonuclease domain-containing protein n=1 Tax=Longimicrobium sp. TaxID=2029185 RepID=UPI002ED9600A
MKISTILDQIDDGGVALPEFQRGYVWNREQVRGLIDSLYKKHPVGSLLVWTTKTENADARGDGKLQAGTVKLLLDGQQRITTLYGMIRGRPPRFFDGNADAFTGLYFHLDDQLFQFYAPLKMGGDPRWISITELMQKGLGEFLQRIAQVPELAPNLTTYINRLNAISSIQEIDLHIEEVTGEDKTVDVVVEIFNKVNSGGTKLSKGDLALAKICAEWPQAREEMQARLRKYERAGFHFELDWLLRNINTILTGEAFFSFLKDVEPAQFRQGLLDAEKHIDRLLNLVASRLGLDHDRVLGSRYSFPLLTRYLVQRGGRFDDHRERDRLLYWYVNTMLWGRYAGSTETVLNQDLRLIEEKDGALDRLIQQLRRDRGDLRIQSQDFTGWSRGARFYPLLYMLTRVWQAQDWETGVELSSHLLGKTSSLQVHHIFPKALLYKHGYDRSMVNALANFTFLTQETNLRVSDRNPAEYLEEFAARNPSVIESHWIPMDRELWRIENYPAFLEARRERLARAANEFLDSLLGGTVAAPESADVPSIVDREVVVVPGGVDSDDEMQLLMEVNDWVVAQGLPTGVIEHEIVDATTGQPLAVFDLAWPNGLQEGLSQPTVLLVGETLAAEEAANAAGYRFFTDVEAFKQHVRHEVLALEEPVPA